VNAPFLVSFAVLFAPRPAFGRAAKNAAFSFRKLGEPGKPAHPAFFIDYSTILKLVKLIGF
jgi:hypothetical protein